jgi:septum formation protein
MSLKRSIVLASASPRRQFLLHEIGFDFTVRKPDVDESFPEDMLPDEVPLFLARKKAAAINSRPGEIIITSDTVVILGSSILNKPASRDEAIDMLSHLAGKTHRVITSVCLTSKDKQIFFSEESRVTFRKLSMTEMAYYVDHFSPFDKAGAYGAQECLPPELNPCSKDEISFLESIGKLDLIEKSISHSQQASVVVLIEKIEGSYFNVMGFPIHHVHKAIVDFDKSVA